MQVFNAFFKTVKRQLSSILIYFIIFLILTILLSSNGKTQEETTYKATKVNVAVIDKDNTTLSKSLYKYMDTNHKIKVISDDKESMADELFYRNVEYILIINDGFEENIKSGNKENIIENLKVSQSVSGYFLDNQIDQFLSSLNIYLSAGSSTNEAAQLALNTSAISTDVKLHTISGNASDRSSIYYFFIYIPYILICMLTVGLGSILVTFRKPDLNSRIQCSALTVTRRNIALTISSLLFSLMCWSIFIVLAAGMYKDEFISIKGLLYLLNTLIFLLIAISTTYLVSYFVHNTSTLNMVSNILGLGLSFLGGIFVPLEYMSSGVVSFARFLPTYWYVKTCEIIETYTGTSTQITNYFSYIGIQFIFALAIFSASLVASKYKKH